MVVIVLTRMMTMTIIIILIKMHANFELFANRVDFSLILSTETMLLNLHISRQTMTHKKAMNVPDGHNKNAAGTLHSIVETSHSCRT